MTSLIARIQPASRSARSVLTAVADALSELDHVKTSETDSLVEIADLGTVLLTRLPGELILNIPSGSAADHNDVRNAVSREIRRAAGSRSAAAKLVVSWSEAAPELSRA